MTRLERSLKPLEYDEQFPATVDYSPAESDCGDDAAQCQPEPPPPAAVANELPAYLRDTYHWAYLSRLGRAFFDRSFVVSAILWGNARRLIRAVLAELEPGQRVLQPACVYGDFSMTLASFLGPTGHLDVMDIARLQVANCRRKLRAFPHVTVRQANAARASGSIYDCVCCFFLLHEVPEDYKSRIVDALLGSVPPGGKVVFVDYHRPHWAHPLKGVMNLVFTFLEPFAKSLWDREIASYASGSGEFAWSKQTYFGGMYQKIVARRGESQDASR